jgi:hypothetical protein
LFFLFRIFFPRFRQAILYRQHHSIPSLISDQTIAGTAMTQERKLQDGKFSISHPVIHWSGFRLNLDYRISADVTDNMIGYGVYSDKGCSREISPSTKPLVHNLAMDPTDVTKPTPSGSSIARLTLLMDPRYLVEAKYVTHDEQRAVVSFCTNLWIKESELSVNIANSRNIPLLVEVNLKDLEGIVGILEDKSLSWQVDTFLCDNDLKKLQGSLPPVSQGERIRLCMAPDDSTLKNGIYISGIDSFSFSRGDHVQAAVASGQTSGDGGVTQIYCPRGSGLCAIDTVLSNRFFFSPGEVLGSGNVFLQFGYVAPDRSLIRKPVQVATDANRALYEVGEAVGEASVSYSVKVEPSTETFQAEAYRCNHLNEPVTGDAPPVQFGESIRICIQPNKEAQQAGVFIDKLGSFYFSRDGGRRQDAVEADGLPAEDGRTLVICSRGSKMCAIKTDLHSWFFFKRGTAEVIGDVYLQFGSQRNSRRAQIVYRYLQEETDGSDPGSAGLSVVSAPFNVAFSSDAGGGPSWWYSSPAWLKVVYALALAIVILILCCCFCGVLFYCRKRKKAKTFIMKTVLDIDVKPERDDSVDARLDSKASFYSDLDFDTDASGNSSDEESITEKFEDDLEADVCAILFPRNPDPDDLSQSLGNREELDQEKQLMPTEHLLGTQIAPPRSNSLPGRKPVDQLSASAHTIRNRGVSPGRRPARGIDPLSMSEHSARVVGHQLAGRYPPRAGRYADPLSMSEHSARVGFYHPSGNFPRRMSEQGAAGRGVLPPYTHPPPLGLSPSRRPRQATHIGMVSTLSQSEHSSHGLLNPLPQQTRRIPKGRKASYNGGYHPDGITQIPRVETLGAPPTTAKVGKKKAGAKKKAGKKCKKGKGKKNSNVSSGEANSIGSGGTKTKNKAANSKTANEGKIKSAVSGSTSGNSGSTGKTTKCSDDEDVSTPQSIDVCFEAEDHAGTKEFLNVTRNALKKFGPSAYSPKIYRHIKRQLRDRRFFICDDDDKPFEWREVTKSELIDLIWKYYEEVKSQMFGVSIEEEDLSDKESVES